LKLGLVGVLFVASALVAAGLLTAAWRRDALAALAGVPLAAAGAGLASVGAARFGTSLREPAAGQEAAVLVMLVALAIVVLGVAAAGPLRGVGGERTPEAPAARDRRRRREGRR
jgi:hypothetical protein